MTNTVSNGICEIVSQSGAVVRAWVDAISCLPADDSAKLTVFEGI